MFRPFPTTLVALALAAALAGCVSGGSAPVPAATAPPAVGGLMAGPLGQPLTEADRERGWTAEITALEAGKRTTWRGDTGNYGYVEPAAVASGAGGACRTYIHTIYLDGRPQKGAGSACRSSSGVWQ